MKVQCITKVRFQEMMLCICQVVQLGKMDLNPQKNLGGIFNTYCKMQIFFFNNSLTPADQKKFLQTKKSFCKCIDPDETAHNELSSGSTMFAILFWFLTENPNWNNGNGQIQTWKSPLPKLRDERVKMCMKNCKKIMSQIHSVSSCISFFYYTWTRAWSAVLASMQQF